MPESRKSYISRTYGETEEWYETLQVVQAGLCAVCRRPNPSRGDEDPPRLNIDHDHFTNRNRGLLCTNCNLILGRIEGKSGSPVEHSTEYLMRFIIYLREHTNGSAIPFVPVGQDFDSLPGSDTSSYCEQTAPCVESGS